MKPKDALMSQTNRTPSAEQNRKSRALKATRKTGTGNSKLPLEVRSHIRKLCDETYQILVRSAEHTHAMRVAPEGTPISGKQLETYSVAFSKNPLNEALQMTLANVPLSLLAEDRSVLMNIDYAYSHTMDKCPKATDQYNSGRCWLFAALNAIRYSLISRFNLQDKFELSEAYLFFYDKLERCNLFLEQMIQMRDVHPNDPVLVGLLTTTGPCCDGGTWDFFVNLIEKYGVVPKTIYDECFNSMSTGEMNEVLMTKLTDYMQVVRKSRASDEKLRKMKDTQFMPEIYSLLVKFMGEPPTQFEWKYHEVGETFESIRDRGTYHLIPNLDPQVFYQTYVDPDFRASRKLLLAHDPRPTSALYSCYTVPFFGNMVGGRPTLHYTVPLSVMKDAVAESIKNQNPVWFACDVIKKYNNWRDLLSVEASNETRALGVTFDQNKAERLISRTTAPTHAMLLVGVDISPDGSYKKWRVENSWGEFYDSHDPGYLQMSDRWFDEYVFEVVVDPCYLPEDVRQKLEEAQFAPIPLDFNDPFGAVACKSPHNIFRSQ